MNILFLIWFILIGLSFMVVGFCHLKRKDNGLMLGLISILVLSITGLVLAFCQLIVLLNS